MIAANNIANAGAKKFFFVGDGYEVIAVFESSGPAEARAHSLNVQHNTTEYVVYQRDFDELENTAEGFAARAAVLID